MFEHSQSRMDLLCSFLGERKEHRVGEGQGTKKKGLRGQHPMLEPKAADL